MAFLDVLAKVVSILSGIIQIFLNCKKYLHSQPKEKDSSACLGATDESVDELQK